MNEETNISCVVMNGICIFDKDVSNFAQLRTCGNRRRQNVVSRDVQEWLQSESWLTVCAYPSGKEFLFPYDKPCEEWDPWSACRWVGKTARSS